MKDLATMLREKTQALHVEAERSGYIQNILRKCASREGYALFLRNLQPAYHVLESAPADVNSHAVLKLFDWHPLFHHSAISLDLAALKGAAWRTKLPVLLESRAYAERIEIVTTTAPDRLLGHA